MNFIKNPNKFVCTPNKRKILLKEYNLQFILFLLLTLLGFRFRRIFLYVCCFPLIVVNDFHRSHLRHVHSLWTFYRIIVFYVRQNQPKNENLVNNSLTVIEDSTVNVLNKTNIQNYFHSKVYQILNWQCFRIPTTD